MVLTILLAKIIENGVRKQHEPVILRARSHDSFYKTKITPVLMDLHRPSSVTAQFSSSYETLTMAHMELLQQ